MDETTPAPNPNIKVKDPTPLTRGKVIRLSLNRQ